MECGNALPLSDEAIRAGPCCKARTCPRAPNYLLPQSSISANHFSHELAAWAGPLAIRTWPLYRYGRYVSEIAALEFIAAAGFLSGIFVWMRHRIRLGLARLGGVAQSLSLRCGFVRSRHAAKLSRQASHGDGQATQCLGQHARTESVVSILGQPHHIRAVLSGPAQLCSPQSSAARRHSAGGKLQVVFSLMVRTQCLARLC